MNNNKQSTSECSIQHIGNAGEVFISNFLIHKGYSIYKTNLRRIGFEADIVAYKKVDDCFLDIRLIEVKTRSVSNKVCLHDLGLHRKIALYVKNKVLVVEGLLAYLLKEEGVMYRYKTSIDLAIVSLLRAGSVKSFVLSKYYQNVNLLM